jgi:hypothetical protein
MTPSDILTDSDLQRVYGAFMQSIRMLLKPDEVDKIFHAYQVQQIRNQYEYVLAVAAVCHEARLFVLKAQLNLKKLEAQALSFAAGAEKIEEIMAHSRDEFEEHRKKYARIVVINLEEVDTLPDDEIREITRQSLIESYINWLKDLDRRSTYTAKRIEQLLGIL